MPNNFFQNSSEKSDFPNDSSRNHKRRSIEAEFKKMLKGTVIAHRGASQIAPENTLSSFKLAAKLNARWIEFDAQPCGSGEWVVIHDNTLDRTTNGHGRVIETPYATLKTLDAGSWFHPNFKGETIPLLSEVLTLVRELGVLPNIEIKLEAQNTLAEKKAYLKSFCEVLENYWPKEALPPLLSSFDFEILYELNSLMPQIPIGMNIEKIEPSLFQLIKQLKPFSVHCNYENLMIEPDVKGRGLQNWLIFINTLGLLDKQNLPDEKKEDENDEIVLLLYTINSKKIALDYLKQDVYAIFSDIPNLIQE